MKKLQQIKLLIIKVKIIILICNAPIPDKAVQMHMTMYNNNIKPI